MFWNNIANTVLRDVIPFIGDAPEIVLEKLHIP